jgi:hypothetical protein
MGINNGNCTSTGNPTGIDCSYNTPSQSTGGASEFSTITSETGGVADPGGIQFTGDSENSWDATTTTLLNLVDGTPLTAFFAFNEQGKSVGLEGTALLTWAEVTLVNTTTGDSMSFFLSSNNGGSGTNTTPPDMDNLPASNTDYLSPDLNPWVYVHSGICTRDIGGVQTFVGFPDSSGACQPGDTLRNQNNLGQNAAAFMINSPALDAALNCKDLLGNALPVCFDVMQVTWKMAYLGGGGETAWFAPVESGGTFVPEPNILANLGIALLILGFVASRRRVG